VHLSRHERVERRDIAGDGVHLFHAGREERIDDGFADAAVRAGDMSGLP
jgi:hypothetical protein